ncbi:hypothetical protein EV122DRAFT_250882 [Schizophyllum commune]
MPLARLLTYRSMSALLAIVLHSLGMEIGVESRLWELSVMSISKAFNLFGLLWVQNCRPGLRSLSIDVRLRRSNQLLLSLKHLKALESGWSRLARAQLERERSMFCPEEDEGLEEEAKSWRFTAWPQNA